MTAGITNRGSNRAMHRAFYFLLARLWVLAVLVGYAQSRLWRWLKDE